MARRKSKAEAAFDDQRVKDARWMARNRRKLPSMDDGNERVRTPDGRSVRRIVAMRHEGGDTVEDTDTAYGEGTRFVPMQGLPRGVDIRSADLSARIRRALELLSDDDQELLRAYYLEGVPWTDLKFRPDESRQAWFERLEWTRMRFLRAWNETAEDPLELTEGDL